MNDRKTLYLARHAKSSWSDMSCGDFNRPLNKRGLHDASAMGLRLRSRGVSPDFAVCSPAKRTRQTAELLYQELGGPMEHIRYEEEIYEASPETLLRIIHELPDHFESVMIIGHNPSIGWLAHELSNAHIDRMPTCAIATIQLVTDHWNEAGRCPAALLDFDYPKKG